ncbi:MAG: PBP1A family penicillin-binding protein [Coriobacteriia bacterium]|nr:PBP1A family penicillin-binding protein [Coriobacteriia bacterium]
MSPERLTRVIKIVVGVLGAMFLALSAAGLYLYRLTLTLPDLETGPESVRPAETSVVYAADGSVIAEWHGEQDRKVVPLADVPVALRDAVVAIEDVRFYEHNGVDARAVVRAAWASAGEAGGRRGGSTITRQLVKLLFAGGERTPGRKVREALLAYQLETKADKDRVLETYLNVVYFGGGSYGVESAAQSYFGKHVSDLTLPESAMLAGLIGAPARYDPRQDPEAARRRRDLVLRRMRDAGAIGEAERREAESAPLDVVAPVDPREVAPHFVEWVKRQLMEEIGADAVYEGGLRVHTTLDPVLQAAAERAARASLPSPQDPEVALVCLEHRTGRVLSMVGGRDYESDRFNLAVQGRRQPGSAFKPFVLVTALEQGVRPDDVFASTPCSIRVRDGVWNVQNYENAGTAGRMTLRAATNRSVNAVYARLVMRVGPEKVVETARRMGIASPLEPNPAIALGGLSKGVSPLEMASAYGTIAAAGMLAPPHGITEVTDPKGKRLYAGGGDPSRAVPADVAVKASLMLHEVVESGTGTEAKLEEWAAGKTGTTQSHRDAWFVGYAGELVTAVWVGYREAQVDMTDVRGIKVTGGTFPARIWKSYMTRALEEQRAPAASSMEKPPRDGDAVLVRICASGMALANKRCSEALEMYLEPTLVPDRVCERH